MLKKILGLIATLLLVLVVLTLMQPTEFRIERSVNITTSADNVFSHISDLKKWSAWSPWFKRDPQMKSAFSVPSNMLGAFSTWESETEGSGKQTIKEFVINKKLVTDLEFYKPFEGKARSDFTLDSLSPNETKLTWGMDSKNKNFIEKFFYLVMDFQKMIGKDYEEGLNSIKKLAENQ